MDQAVLDRFAAIERVVQEWQGKVTELATAMTELRGEVPAGIMKSIADRFTNVEATMGTRTGELSGRVDVMMSLMQKGGPRRGINTKDGDKHMPLTWSGDKGSRSFGELTFEMLNWASSIDRHGGGAKLMMEAAADVTEVSDDWVSFKEQSNENAWEFCRVLANTLVSITAGTAKNMTRKVLQASPGNGLKAWQSLARWFRPNNAMEASTALTKIMTPERQKTVHDLHRAVAEWELRVVEYEARFNEQVSETTKLSALKMMMPHSVLEKYIDSITSFQDVRARLANYMTEYFSNGCGGKQTGPVPMEIGHVDKERVDDAVQPDAKDWKDLAAAVSEQVLCQLGKGGKGASKGGKGGGKTGQDRPQPYSAGKAGAKGNEKGKGKGKDGKGLGQKRVNPNVQCWTCWGFGHPARLCPSVVNNVEDSDEEAADRDEEEDDPCLCLLSTAWTQVAGKRSVSRSRAAVGDHGARIKSYAGHNMFGYLESDDGGVEMELNGLETKDEKNGWRRLTVVVDSGAGENVMPVGVLDFAPIKPTPRSKAGKGFRGAGGEQIANHGEQRVICKTKEGQTRRTTWQVADVRRPLMSVSRMAAAGNEIILNGHNPRVINKKTNEVTHLRREGNVYVLDLWVQLPIVACTRDVKAPASTAASAAKATIKAPVGGRKIDADRDIDMGHVKPSKTVGFARQAA